MDPENRPKVAIEFEATGERWDKVESYRISDSFMVDTDSWEVTVFDDADPAGLRRKFLPKTPVRLYYGQRLQLIGRIDATECAGESGKSLRVSGRDYIAEILNASIDKSIVITNTMTLEKALLEALRPFGISTIETNVDEVIRQKMGPQQFKQIESGEESPLKKYKAAFDIDTQAFIDAIKPTITVSVSEKMEEFSPDKNADEGVWEWCNKIAARFGGKMQPGSSRSAVAFVVPDYAKSPGFAFLRPGNVISATASRNWESIPTHTRLSGRKVDLTKQGKGNFKGISIRDLPIYQIDECKRIIDAANTAPGRIGRTTTGNPLDWYCPVYYRDDSAKSEKQLDKSAKRVMAEQVRETLTYEVTVKGHEAPLTGAVYATNVLADVQDSIADVNETLWIMERTLTFSGGEQTEMKLIRPASYAL